MVYLSTVPFSHHHIKLFMCFVVILYIVYNNDSLEKLYKRLRITLGDVNIKFYYKYRIRSNSRAVRGCKQTLRGYLALDS